MSQCTVYTAHIGIWSTETEAKILNRLPTPNRDSSAILKKPIIHPTCTLLFRCLDQVKEAVAFVAHAASVINEAVAHYIRGLAWEEPSDYPALRFTVRKFALFVASRFINLVSSCL